VITMITKLETNDNSFKIQPLYIHRDKEDGDIIAAVK
jgi:hypothetical protein